MKYFAKTFLGTALLASSFACNEIPTSDFLVESTVPVVGELGALQLDVVASVKELTADVGRPNKGAGQFGGFTATFTGDGGSVCVILDPEGLETDLDPEDDGDSDLYVGKESDYTGTPGVTVGLFEGFYEDALGVIHKNDLNRCVVQYTDYFGRPGAHAGLGKVEYCVVSTDAGVVYYVVGKTFSVPNDDANLKVSVAIVETIDNGGEPGCPSITETTLTGDSSS